MQAQKTVEAFQGAAPTARQPLTTDQIVDAVRDADLDWHSGWVIGDEAVNCFETLVRAVEAAHGITQEGE
jgi:hypothetical protein